MSGSEVAFFSLSPQDLEDIKEKKHPNDAAVEEVLMDSERLLGTILIGNNFVNVAIVMLSEFAIQSIFDFSRAPVLGFIIQVIGLTFLLLLFGEIIPKIYCKQNTLNFVRFSAPKMKGISKFFSPLSGVLVRMGNSIGRAVGQRKYELSAEELSKAIQLTTDKEEEKGLLTEIVKFYSKSVSDVMTPRMDMATIEYNTPYSEVLKFVVDNGYSRIPVYKERVDDVKGILYVKDLLAHIKKDDRFKWQSILREPFYVPETKMVDDLLEEFRKHKIHMAIVVDEFGGTSGLITMEDLLEEVVGEISDEYDDDDSLHKKLSDGSFIFDAKISLIDFLRITKIPENYFIDLKDDVDTLGGLILEHKGDFPVNGETVQIGSYKFKILEMGRRRISKVHFIPPTK